MINKAGKWITIITMALVFGVGMFLWIQSNTDTVRGKRFTQYIQRADKSHSELNGLIRKTFNDKLEGACQAKIREFGLSAAWYESELMRMNEPKDLAELKVVYLDLIRFYRQVAHAEYPVLASTIDKKLDPKQAQAVQQLQAQINQSEAKYVQIFRAEFEKAVKKYNVQLL